MKISKSSLILTSAFTGMLGGTVARAATMANASATSGISSIAGQAADDSGGQLFGGGGAGEHLPVAGDELLSHGSSGQ